MLLDEFEVSYNKVDTVVERRFAFIWRFIFVCVFVCVSIVGLRFGVREREEQSKVARKQAAEMEQREILVTLISASDLKKVTAFGKMSVYCVAWIYPNIKVSSPMDKKGNLNPTWNATLKLMADERLVEDGNAVLVIDLYDHGTFGNKNVGSCTIPLSGLKAPAKATTEKEGKEDKGADKTPAATSSEGGSSSSSSNFMSVPVREHPTPCIVESSCNCGVLVLWIFAFSPIR